MPIFDFVQEKALSGLIATVSSLQVSRTGIHFRTSSNFGHIIQFILELLAFHATED